MSFDEDSLGYNVQSSSLSQSADRIPRGWEKKRGKYGNAVHPSDLAALNTEALFLFPFGLYLLTRFIWLSVHSGWLRGDFKW